VFWVSVCCVVVPVPGDLSVLATVTTTVPVSPGMIGPTLVALIAALGGDLVVGQDQHRLGRSGQHRRH
jgi:hypothetical protein